MKIVWNENPLLTQIFLDEHEKKEFWYKIKLEEMEELLSEAWFHMQQDKYPDFYDLKRALSNVNPNYFCPEWEDHTKKGQKSELDKRVDELFEMYIGDLEHNPHCGDCTCVACSCSKCHAESLLGLDTIKGLGKHEASSINGAFRKTGTKFPERDNQRTIRQALATLSDWIPTSSWDGAEKHYDRWIQENFRAISWLKEYREEHFNVDSNTQLGDNSNAHK